MEKKLLLFFILLLIKTGLNAQPNDLGSKAIPEANFKVNDSVICTSQYVTFNDLSLNSPNKWVWYFEGGTPDSSKVKSPPKIYYYQPGTYNVTLIVSNSSGNDTLIKSDYILVEACAENYVFVPNIFTPNEDGQNDVLIIRGPDVIELHMYIYDRWGKKVYEIHDKNDVWNGEIKGQKAEQGTYVYFIDVIFKDGEISRKKGNFTLIR